MRSALFFAVAVFTFVGILSQAIVAGAAEPRMFQIGAVRVWAIADNTGDRDMSAFIGDADVIKQYAPSGKSPSATLCFLLESAGGMILLDAGNGNPPGDARASLLMDGLRTIGVNPGKVDAVVISHMHGDHIGGLAWEGKAAFPNAVVKIGRIEHDFWMDESNLEQFPDRKANFDLAKRILALYDGKVETFEFGAEVAPSLTAMDARGHTPGHTAFLLESEGGKLLCIGDLLHSAALQFARPDINARYDMLPDHAKLARREFLAKAAWGAMPIAGVHLPFPGIGEVREDGQGGFSFLSE